MSHQVVFTAPGRAEVQSFIPPDVVDDQVLIKTEFSIVSAGTELACLSGKESWAPLPFVPGYGSVGRVAAQGPAAKGIAIGQRVFTYGRHASHSLCEKIIVPLSEDLDPVSAVFARLGGVAMTSLRVSRAELGDTVAVLGLGLVGNLAAQLFTLTGCEVIGVDPSPVRRETALRCGIAHAMPPGDDLRERIAAVTRGGMCESVVEATGNPAVAEAAPGLAGKQGEVVLLGSPRGSRTTDITPFLNQVHLWGKCVTLKGAHEWRYPLQGDAEGHTRHSIERNIRCLLRLIGRERLHIAPLLTQCVSPHMCQQVYDGLTSQKDAYMGVVFDWSAA